MMTLSCSRADGPTSTDSEPSVSVAELGDLVLSSRRKGSDVCVGAHSDALSVDIEERCVLHGGQLIVLIAVMPAARMSARLYALSYEGTVTDVSLDGRPVQHVQLDGALFLLSAPVGAGSELRIVIAGEDGDLVCTQNEPAPRCSLNR